MCDILQPLRHKHRGERQKKFPSNKNNGWKIVSEMDLSCAQQCSVYFNIDM